MADTVPAMLEPGEYVIRKDAAEELGPSLLNMLNNADRLGYKGGGYADRVGYQEGGEAFSRTATRKEQEAGKTGGYDVGVLPVSYYKNLPTEWTEGMSNQERVEMLQAQNVQKDLNTLMTSGIQPFIERPEVLEWLENSEAYPEPSDSLAQSTLDWIEKSGYQKLSASNAEDFLIHMAEVGQKVIEPDYFRKTREKYRPDNKQQGGYIDEYQEGGYANMPEDYSLLDLTMPIMDDRLGPVGVKKYEHGGDVYGGFSVSPEQIFQEQGLRWDPDYGETIEEYDPTRERQLGQSLMGKVSAPGSKAGTFADIGGYGKGKQAREEQRRGYFSGVAGLRGEYMGDVTSQLAQDIADETFDFTQMQGPHFDPNDPSTFPTGGAAGNIAGQYFNPPPQNPYDGQTWQGYTYSESAGEWV